MMFWRDLISVALLVTSAAAASARPEPPLNVGDYINSNVLRSLDLETHVVKERRAISVSTDKETQGHPYYFIADLVEGVSVANVSVKQNDMPLLAELMGMERQNDGRTFWLYKTKISLDSKGKSGKEATAVIVVDLIYIGLVWPFPAEISQGENQYVRMQGFNAYMTSPYETRRQRLKIQLPAKSSSVEDYSKEPAPVEKSGKVLNYGPYDEFVMPFSYRPITVHYEYSKPLLIAEEMKRELWISHWGSNLMVEEHFTIINEAARSKDQFSRAEFTIAERQNKASSIMSSISFDLPTDASDVYYRDDIGNVSTSSLRHETFRSHLQLRPRYPLFGGWRYKWYQGYNVPLSQHVYQYNGRYVFRANVVETLPDMPIRAFTLKIVLPEDARDISLHFPFDVDHRKETTYTYLDTVGRPTLYINMENLVGQHSVPFEITYSMATYSFLRKIIVPSLGFLLIFVLSIVYWRVEGQDEAKIKKQ